MNVAAGKRTVREAIRTAKRHAPTKKQQFTAIRVSTLRCCSASGRRPQCVFVLLRPSTYLDVESDPIAAGRCARTRQPIASTLHRAVRVMERRIFPSEELRTSCRLAAAAAVTEQSDGRQTIFCVILASVLRRLRGTVSRAALLSTVGRTFVATLSRGRE